MGAFKLGKMTLGSLFKKPETIMYPVVKKPQPMGLKGHIEIEAADCILCGMCDRSCTTNCISVDKQRRTWSIDRLQCVQCGYCITVCPKKCLSMDPNYAPASTAHETDVVAIPGQEKPAGKKPAAKEAPAATGAKAGQPASVAAPEAGVAAAPAKDAQLDALIAMMDPEKAEKVRAVL